jgi:DNA-3-methyladenine glycosylase
VTAGPPGPAEAAFYARPALEVAPELVGCTLRYGGSAGRIVETEAYHQFEPACHAYAGLTPRTEILFGPAGNWYVYRSYGIHALMNTVTGIEGEGEAVLIRALEPLEGIEQMFERRGVHQLIDLTNGPGKLSQALGVGLEMNGTPIGDPIEILPRKKEPRIAIGPRIGITQAVELPWRFCDADSRSVSRPWPPGMRP